MLNIYKKFLNKLKSKNITHFLYHLKISQTLINKGIERFYSSKTVKDGIILKIDINFH